MSYKQDFAIGQTQWIVLYSLRNKKIKDVIIYWNLLVAFLIWLSALLAFTIVVSLVLFWESLIYFLRVSLCPFNTLDFFTMKKKNTLLTTLCTLSFKEITILKGSEYVHFILCFAINQEHFKYHLFKAISNLKRQYLAKLTMFHHLLCISHVLDTARKIQ